MKVTAIALAIIAWLTCAVWSYRIVYTSYKREKDAWFLKWRTDDSPFIWTVADRWYFLGLSVLSGPIALLTSWIVYGKSGIFIRRAGKKRANW